jgi:hypothetical protein
MRVPARNVSSALQQTRARADNLVTMRTLGFRTHLLLVLAGAAGLIASLGRPWYAAAPGPNPDGSLQSLADAMQRWITSTGGDTGWHALGDWATALAGLSALSVACALGCTLPAVANISREPLRYATFAAFGIASWKLVDSPGPNQALEIRFGAIIGVVSALMLAVSAQGVANAPLRRRVTQARYVAPPPPPAY